MPTQKTQYVGGPVRSRVLEMKRGGMKPREIAGALGITTQRVYQHIKALREAGSLENGKRSA